MDRTIPLHLFTGIQVLQSKHEKASQSYLGKENIICTGYTCSYEKIYTTKRKIEPLMYEKSYEKFALIVTGC